MWEQIRANKRKSTTLIIVMAFILIGLGYAIGFGIGGQPETAYIGVGGAVVLWAILCLTALGGGNAIMLATAGATKLEEGDLPVVRNCVEEMSIASGLPKPPEVYLIDDNAPNAFAVGSPRQSAVAVTTGLVSRLNRDEIQGVIAHEIGHIRNHDTRFMVMAGVLVGAIVIISDIFLRGVFRAHMYGGGRRSSGGGKGGNQAQAIMMIVALVAAILAPIFAHLLYFACSRKREYLADASAARFTRYPEGLARALEKISGAVSTDGHKANRVIAPMYIINPLAAHGAAGLGSTHPPTEKRIQILRAMGGGAAYANYEKAYEKVSGAGAPLIGASSLTADTGEVGVREASEAPERTPAKRRREAVDTLRLKSGFRFADCQCGLRLKVPPVFQKPALGCPSCGRMVPIPAAPGAAAGPPAELLKLRLTDEGWQSVRCSCGADIEVSPEFSATRMKCRKCGRRIEFER